MIPYPAMDLRAGKCVRLSQGDFNRQQIYHDDPLAVAREFAEQQAQYLHIVDLDGAKNSRITQIELIEKIIARFPGRAQVGGGVRSLDDVRRLLDIGAARVLVGSVAVSTPGLVQEWIELLGQDKIVLALDFRITKATHIPTPMLATLGWQQESSLSLWDFLADFPQAEHVLCTDIELDGMQTGASTEIYSTLRQRFPHLKLQASGGIKDLEDLIQLRSIGVSACIIGRALYEGNFTLREALLC